MKYELPEPFLNDYKRLSPTEKQRFREAVRLINEAYERHNGPGLPTWPHAVRIRSVVSARGVWEMTWSFAGPDGRATFEFIPVDGEPAIRWRRIGTHDILRQP